MGDDMGIQFNARRPIAITAAAALAAVGIVGFGPPAADHAVTAPIALAANPSALDYFGASATNFAKLIAYSPLTPVMATAALFTGDDDEFKHVLGEAVTGPQWALDPALEALAVLLPAELGGGTGHDPYTGIGDGALLQFRNTTMLAARDDVLSTVLAAADVLIALRNTPETAADSFGAAADEVAFALDAAWNGTSGHQASPLGTIAALPLAGAYLVQAGAAATGNPLNNAVEGLASSVGTVPGAAVSGTRQVGDALAGAQLNLTAGVAWAIHRTGAAVETGDPAMVIKTIAEQRKALRSGLADYTSDKLAGGSLAAIRTAVDTARNGLSTAVITKLPPGAMRDTANNLKTKAGELRTTVRTAVDKLGSQLKKTSDRVDDGVKAAVD